MIETEVCSFWSLESIHTLQHNFSGDEYTKNSVLSISFFWNVTLHHWIMECDTASLDNWIQTFWGNIISSAWSVIMSKNTQNIFWHFGSCTVWLLKLRKLHGFIMLGSDYPVTQHHFPEEWNLRYTITETSKCALLYYY
jgi:hypothetical protein